jgi:UDP-glucose 4-epimerase
MDRSGVKMKKALVTGGSGFLGSHIADELVERGFDVTILDRRPSTYLREGQSMMVGDILNVEDVARAVDGADCVFHLGGFSDLNAARTQPLGTVRLNIEGTINILEACRRSGARRLLFASTIYVYSREGGFYRCSKQACETYIEEFHRKFGLEYTILRYGSLYGPRSDIRNGVYRLLQQAARGEPIDHHGTPEDTREYIHVQDAARLSVDALDHRFVNQHLVLTGQYPMRIRDLFTMFSEILGREVAVEYLETQDGEPNGHYTVTPYAYHPRVGRKLTTNLNVDMGQGILQILEEIHREDGPSNGVAGVELTGS